MKSIFFSFLMAWYVLAYGQKDKYQLSTHILDISAGHPAAGVLIKLWQQSDDSTLQFVAEAKTDQNGRINDFLPSDPQRKAAIYKLIFYTQPCFDAQAVSSFYPFVEVNFAINDHKQYHVPIVISPYGYSTYRES